jgi:hypothetical protein
MTKRYTTLRIEMKPGEWQFLLIPITPMAEPAATPKRTTRPTPQSLQQFIAKSGGLNPYYNNGQWGHELAMIRDGGNRGLMPGVLNKAAKFTAEEMALACVTAGYITDPDVDLMLWALSKDVEATASKEQWNRVYGHSGEDFASDLAYSRWLESLPEEDQLAA